jgi:hypothetical protein
MPIHGSTQSASPFFQYGKKGKKYTYKGSSPLSRKRAKQKAVAQALAIQYSQMRAGKRSSINLSEH